MKKYKENKIEKSRAAAKAWYDKNKKPGKVFYTPNLKKEDILKPIAKEKQSTHTEQGYQKSDKAVHVSKEISKEKLITILQATLFNSEGKSEKDIMELNPDYNLEWVRKGIEIFELLKSEEEFIN